MILTSELTNVLLGFVRRGSITLDQARANDAVAVLGPRVVTVSADRVLDLALECGLSACDAEFVVVARELGVRLATGDSAILRGAGDVAVGV